VFGDVQHDHIILVAHSGAIRLLNTSHVPGVQTTEFPADPEQFSISLAVQSRLHAEEKVDERWLQDNNWVRDLGWCIDLDSRFVADGEVVKVVDMGLNGEMIVAAGSKGSTWIWMKDL
jgi:polycomb protein EED